MKYFVNLIGVLLFLSLGNLIFAQLVATNVTNNNTNDNKQQTIITTNITVSSNVRSEIFPTNKFTKEEIKEHNFIITNKEYTNFLWIQTNYKWTNIIDRIWDFEHYVYVSNKISITNIFDITNIKEAKIKQTNQEFITNNDKTIKTNNVITNIDSYITNISKKTNIITSYIQTNNYTMFTNIFMTNYYCVIKTNIFKTNFSNYVITNETNNKPEKRVETNITVFTNEITNIVKLPYRTIIDSNFTRVDKIEYEIKEYYHTKWTNYFKVPEIDKIETIEIVRPTVMIYKGYWKFKEIKDISAYRYNTIIITTNEKIFENKKLVKENKYVVTNTPPAVPVEPKVAFTNFIEVYTNLIKGPLFITNQTPRMELVQMTNEETTNVYKYKSAFKYEDIEKIITNRRGTNIIITTNVLKAQRINYIITNRFPILVTNVYRVRCYFDYKTDIVKRLALVKVTTNLVPPQYLNIAFNAFTFTEDNEFYNDTFALGLKLNSKADLRSIMSNFGMTNNKIHQNIYMGYGMVYAGWTGMPFNYTLSMNYSSLHAGTGIELGWEIFPFNMLGRIYDNTWLANPVLNPISITPNFTIGFHIIQVFENYNKLVDKFGLYFAPSVYLGYPIKFDEENEILLQAGLGYKGYLNVGVNDKPYVYQHAPSIDVSVTFRKFLIPKEEKQTKLGTLIKEKN